MEGKLGLTKHVSAIAEGVMFGVRLWGMDYVAEPELRSVGGEERVTARYLMGERSSWLVRESGDNLAGVWGKIGVIFGDRVDAIVRNDVHPLLALSDQVGAIETNVVGWVSELVEVVQATLEQIEGIDARCAGLGGTLHSAMAAFGGSLQYRLRNGGRR